MLVAKQKPERHSSATTHPGTPRRRHFDKATGLEGGHAVLAFAGLVYLSSVLASLFGLAMVVGGAGR